MCIETGCIIDISNFAKYVVSGENAREWLDAEQNARSWTLPTPLSQLEEVWLATLRSLCPKDEYWILGSGMAEPTTSAFNAVKLPKGVTLKVGQTLRFQCRRTKIRICSV